MDYQCEENILGLEFVSFGLNASAEKKGTRRILDCPENLKAVHVLCYKIGPELLRPSYVSITLIS